MSDDVSEYAQGPLSFANSRSSTFPLDSLKSRQNFNFLQRTWTYENWTNSFFDCEVSIAARDMTVSFFGFWPFAKNNTSIFSKLIFSPEGNEKLSTMFN